MNLPIMDARASVGARARALCARLHINVYCSLLIRILSIYKSYFTTLLRYVTMFIKSRGCHTIRTI